MVMVTISHNMEKGVKGFERIMLYSIYYNSKLRVKSKEKSYIELTQENLMEFLL